MKKVLIILLLPLSIYAQTDPAEIDSAVYVMHEVVNKYRLLNNVNTLELDTMMCRLAQNHAIWMYNNEFKHSDLPYWENCTKHSGVSENFWRKSIKQSIMPKFYSLIYSPAHNTNMLNSRFYQAGYGFYRGMHVQLFN